MSLTNRAKKTLGREVNLGASTGDSVAGSAATRTWILYLVDCANGAFYNGITTDLKRRIEEHASGASCIGASTVTGCWMRVKGNQRD